MKKFLNIGVGLSLVAMLFSVLGFAPNSQKPMQEAHSPIHAKPNASTSPIGYIPSQIKTAYGLNQVSATGSGQTIAIVVAYGSPTITNDPAVFSQQFSLPPANLTIAYPGGKPKTNANWALETSLDVEWAHALAPDAKIL